MSDIYRTWVRRIESGTFTHAVCRQFAQAVCQIAEGGIVRGKKTNLTEEEAIELVNHLHAVGVRLTPQQTEYGLEWLKLYSSKRFQHWPADAIDNFSHFQFHGERVVLGQYQNSILPVWRMVLKDGRVLAYYVSPWQGLGDCEWQWIREEPVEGAVEFGSLQPDGTLTNQRSISRADLLRCPHVILVAEHYREDGSCRCDEGQYDDDGNWVPFDQTKET